MWSSRQLRAEQKLEKNSEKDLKGFTVLKLSSMTPEDLFDAFD